MKPVDSYKMPKMHHAYMRPSDAATLILVDTSKSVPTILMGKRHESLKFMPGKFVFPGGRVDPVDSRIKPARPLDPKISDQLARSLNSRGSKNKPQALAMAAVREMFEETGLLIGEETANPPKSRAPSWQAFFDENIVPTLDQMIFIARAVTPPGRPRRFDTRFFMADANIVTKQKVLEPSPTNELLELNWLTIGEALDKELANITQIVLQEIDARLKGDTDRSIPYYVQRGSTVYRNDI